MEQRRRGPGLSSLGNRIGLAVLVAWLTWLVVRGSIVPLLVGLVFFVILTAVVSLRRNP